MMTHEGPPGESGAGVTRVYVRPERDQLFLLPVSMREWVGEDHLAWFVIDVVAELDTRALHRRPGGALGRPPYDPQMMCAVLLYAYCCGIRSSRQIENACRTDAAFRVICGGLVPDHATLARFVVDQEQALAGLFTCGLRLCAAAGLTDLSVVALDGTKMAADAALDRNRDRDWISKEVAKLLARTAAEQRSLGTSPGVLEGRDPQLAAGPARPGGRLDRLRAALAVIEAQDDADAAAVAREAREAQRAARDGRILPGRKPKDPAIALARARADHQAALARTEAKRVAREATEARARAEGRTMTGPVPGPDRSLPRAQAVLAAAEQAALAAGPAACRVNVTDPDSRIMSTAKGWIQGYNAQAIANQQQIVLACHVSQDTGDVLLYQPMITLLTDTLTAAGINDAPILALADAGYWSHENATAPGPDRLIATLKDHKQRAAARDLGHTTGPPPPGATPTDAMEHRLRTPEGAAAYAQRSHTIEPVFADRKQNRGMRGFRRRGLSAVNSEWAFMNLAANMLKLRQHRITATA